jgi:hypothetical protein
MGLITSGLTTSDLTASGPASKAVWMRLKPMRSYKMVEVLEQALVLP